MPPAARHFKDKCLPARVKAARSSLVAWNPGQAAPFYTESQSYWTGGRTVRREPPARLRRAVESRGFTAVLVSLALAALVTIVGMVAFPTDVGPTRQQSAADAIEADRFSDAVRLGERQR
jgi:hypothetical protein